MSGIVSAEVIAAVAVGILIALIVLLVLQVLLGFRVQRITSPIYEYALSKSQAEADRIVSEAREHARKIVADAQLAADSLLGEFRNEIAARLKTYDKSLEAVASETLSHLKDGVAALRKVQDETAQHISDGLRRQSEELKAQMDSIGRGIGDSLKNVQDGVKDMQRALEEEGKLAVENTKQSFADASVRGVSQINEQSERLLKMIEAEAEAYREARKKLVDERAVDLVADMTKLVLQKTLDVDEHAKLIEQALSEARSVGIL